MLCFDTSFLVDYVDGREATATFLAANEREAFYTPTVALFELHRGEIDPEAGRDRETISGWFDWAQPLPLSAAAAAEAATIDASLHDDGSPIGARDALIAGIARDAGATVVTRNTDEFRRVPSLDVVSY